MIEPGSYSVRLALAVPCDTCREPRAALTSGACSVCGDRLPEEMLSAVREAVHRRREVFKRRLRVLEKRMHEVTDGSLTFPRRGAVRADDAHLSEILRPAIDILRARQTRIAQLCETGTWDPDDKGCLDTFGELVGQLDAAVDFVIELRDTQPPVEWRAVHRELARAAVFQARGHTYLALTISAPDLDTALRLQDIGNEALAISGKHARRVASLLGLIDQQPSDGPFQLDGSLDIAALAWSSVGQGSMSIAESATLVREAFADAPGLAELPDEYTLGLLPLLAASAKVVDREVLIVRAIRFRALLDSADAVGPWVTEPDLLVARINRGLERAMAQAERLGREWQYGLPRAHVAHSMTEVFRQLVEGALVDIGGVVLLAARAGRGDTDSSFQRDVVEGIKAGEVVDELGRHDVAHGGAVDMLYRNASAHDGIEITETGIIATERVIRNGRVESSTTITLSDAEFAEEMARLEELLLALQLSLLPWLWAHDDDGVAGALASVPLSIAQRDRTIALLGGIAGLDDVTVASFDDVVTITGVLRPDDTDRRETLILSLVPAAFAAVPAVTRVTLSLAEVRPVEFTRAEFEGSDSDGSVYGLTLLALTTAKWLVASGISWTERDEATYITFPLTQVCMTSMQLAGSEPHATENIDQAVDALRIVRARLGDILPSDRQSTLTRHVVEQIEVLAAAMTGLAEARRGRRTSREGQDLARKAVTILSTVHLAQQQAQAIRDRQLSTDS